MEGAASSGMGKLEGDGLLLLRSEFVFSGQFEGKTLFVVVAAVIGDGFAPHQFHANLAGKVLARQDTQLAAERLPRHGFEPGNTKANSDFAGIIGRPILAGLRRQARGQGVHGEISFGVQVPQ